MSAASLSQDECIIAKTAADDAAVLDEVIQVVGQFRWRWLRRDNRLQGLFKLRDIALQHIPNHAEIYVGVIMNQAMPQARPALRVATSYGNGFFADPRGKSRR